LLRNPGLGAWGASAREKDMSHGAEEDAAILTL